MTIGAADPRPVVRAPKVLRRVAVEYSEETGAKGMRGIVALSFVVNASGRAEQIKVIRANEFELGKCSMRAVAQREFQPGILAGKPVPANARVEMDLDARRK